MQQQDNTGKTALLAAASKGRVETVDTLLKHGADPNARDHMGVAGLHAVLALREQGEARVEVPRGTRMQLIKLLLAHGADIGQGDALAFSPLHVAAERGLAAEAELLCSAGADPEAPNGYGLSAKEVAEGSVSAQEVKALLKAMREGQRHAKEFTRAARTADHVAGKLGRGAHSGNVERGAATVPTNSETGTAALVMSTADEIAQSTHGKMDGDDASLRAPAAIVNDAEKLQWAKDSNLDPLGVA